MNKRQARFWVWYKDGPVRIKLNTGQTLHKSYCVETDEGYSAEGHRWEFDGQIIRSEIVSDSRDCDGRMRRSWESECSYRNRAAGVIDSDYRGVVYPAWQHIGAAQRDYSAEAMGY